MPRSIVALVILQIVTALAVSFGVVEREAVFFVTAMLLLFIALGSLEEGMVLFIVSIPFFFALPFSELFDSMANWRILVIALFIKYILTLWKTYVAKVSRPKVGDFWVPKKIISDVLHSKLLIVAAAFIAWGTISSLQAVYFSAGIKKMLFLTNIFLLFPIILFIIKKNGINKVLLAIWYSLFSILAIGFTQLISLFVVPLEQFWRFWAGSVIPVFYGYNLGELLQTANTWFASGGGGPPTLRMFSVFPDSHSFAMFVMLGLVVPVALWLVGMPRRRAGGLLSVILAGFLALIFSGSRGVWLSAAGVVTVLGGMWASLNWKKCEGNSIFFVKRLTALFVLFGILFLPASLISSLTQRAQGGIADSLTGIKRVRSITDFEEVSNRSRLQIWKAALGTIAERPVFGVGPGNFSVALGEDIGASRKGASAHNLYLDIASEMGVPGLLLFLLLIGRILYRMLSSIFTVQNSESRAENLERSESSIQDSKFIIQKSMPMVFSVYFLWILGYSFFDVVLLNDKVCLFATILAACCYETAISRQPDPATAYVAIA